MALNILVVDDSSVMRSIITKTLHLSNLPLGEIYEASNGQEGLEMIDKNWIDLVLADINMPVMDGLEMIDRLKQNPETEDLSVIIVTAKSIDKDVEILIKKGTGYIHKPFTPETLRETVISMIGGLDEQQVEDEVSKGDNLEKKLYKAVALVFEELCLMLPSSELEEGQQNARFEAAGSVGFQGPFSGRLVVTICGGLLPTMATNIKGKESTSRKEQFDALGEVANVICGNLLPTLAGSEKIFNIAAPEIVENVESSVNNAEPKAMVQLGLEKGRADVLLFFDNDATSYFKERQE